MPVFHTFCIILPSHWSRAGLDQDHQVGRLFGRLTVVDCPLMIISKVEPFSIPGMRNNWPRQSFAQLTLDLVQQGFHFFALVHRSYTQHFDFRNMTRNKTNLQREMLYKKTIIMLGLYVLSCDRDFSAYHPLMEKAPFYLLESRKTMRQVDDVRCLGLVLRELIFVEHFPKYNIQVFST